MPVGRSMRTNMSLNTNMAMRLRPGVARFALLVALVLVASVIAPGFAFARADAGAQPRVGHAGPVSGSSIGNVAMRVQRDDQTNFVNESFGYSVTYDEAIWMVAEDSGDEVFTLDNGTSVLQFIPLPYRGALEDGFETFTSASTMENDSPSVSDWEPARDGNGDPLAGTTSRGVYGVFTYTFTDGDDVERRVAYVEFRSLVEGESIIAMIAVTFNRTTYNADVVQVLDVIATLQIDDPGTASDDGRDQQDTPAPDDGNGGDNGTDNDTPEADPDDYPDIDDDVWIMNPQADPRG